MPISTTIAFSPPISASNLPSPDVTILLEWLEKSWKLNRWSNGGPALLELEERLAEFHEVRHVVATSSGFWALVLASRALCPPGKRVLLPSLTYRRMADAMARAGLIPRFVDIDPHTLAARPEHYRAALDENVGLVLGVHPMVGCCDAPGIEAFAKEHNLPVLFDAVESPYEILDGKRTGGFGACEVFSLHASKLLSACEGGYITTNDDALASELRHLRSFGFAGEDRVVALGTNAKMPELHAAWALACLVGVGEQVERHRRRYLAYEEALGDVRGLSLRPYDPTVRPSWRQIVVEIREDWPLSREETVFVLNRHGALARPYYSPPLHQKTTSYPQDVASLPNTECLAQRLILMPSGERVTVEQIHMLGELLQEMARGDTPLLEPPEPTRPQPTTLQPHLPGEQPSFDPAAPTPTPAVGTPWPMPWSALRNAALDVVRSGWYTNHGPRAQAFESALADLFQVSHAIVVTNATIGLMAAIVALARKGPVLVPAFTFPATAQAALWAGAEVELCDVDPVTHHVDVQLLEKRFDELVGAGCRPSAILAVNLWGNLAPCEEIDDWAAAHRLPVIYDSAHAVGTTVHGAPTGRHGLAEVVSFHATKILSCAEGGAVLTNDDEFADAIRNVRSSYGLRKQVSVPATVNGRFSELQAALGLVSLSQLPSRIEQNQTVLRAYREELASVPGLRFYEPRADVQTNGAYCPIEIDPKRFGVSRNGLKRLLDAHGVRARRYFYPGLHRIPPFAGRIDHRWFPGTTHLTERVLVLPVGPGVDPDKARWVARIIKSAAHG